MNCNAELSNDIRSNFPVGSVGGARMLVYGFGVNDADYTTTPLVGGKQMMCPAYMAWREMIRRAYSKAFHLKSPSYIVVSVCDEWRSFMQFRGWWMENQVDGWQIDKDLTSAGNRQYSPEFCVFVPNWLNNFVNVNKKYNSSGFVGCSFEAQTRSFKAQCQNPITGKNENLGRYKTADEAGAAWRIRKLEIASSLKCFMDGVDKRIYETVISAISA